MNKQREVQELPHISHNGPFLVILGKYQTGNPAISILSKDERGNWEPFMIASTNIAGINPRENEVAIKNYSENVGIEDALIELNVLGKYIRSVSSGFVGVNLYELNTSWWDEPATPPVSQEYTNP